MGKWFTLSWYQYLFKDHDGILNVLCRMRGHPNGVVWLNFNPYKLEPDMRCKDCGEDLG